MQKRPSPRAVVLLLLLVLCLLLLVGQRLTRETLAHRLSAGEGLSGLDHIQSMVFSDDQWSPASAVIPMDSPDYQRFLDICRTVRIRPCLWHSQVQTVEAAAACDIALCRAEGGVLWAFHIPNSRTLEMTYANGKKAVWKHYRIVDPGRLMELRELLAAYQ